MSETTVTGGTHELRARELAARLPRLWLGETSDSALAQGDRALASSWRKFTEIVLASKLDCCVSEAYDGASVDGLNRRLADKYLSTDPSAAFVMSGVGQSLSRFGFGGGSEGSGASYRSFDFGEFEWLLLEPDAEDAAGAPAVMATEAARRQASLFARSPGRSAARRPAPAARTRPDAPASARTASTPPVSSTRTASRAAEVQPYPARMGRTGATLRPRVSAARMQPAALQLAADRRAATSFVRADALADTPEFVRMLDERVAASFVPGTDRAGLARSESRTSGSRRAASTTVGNGQGSRDSRRSPHSAMAADPAPKHFDAAATSAGNPAPRALRATAGSEGTFTLDGLQIRADRMPALASALTVASSAFPSSDSGAGFARQPGTGSTRQPGVFSPDRMAPALRIASLGSAAHGVLTAPSQSASASGSQADYRRLLYDAGDHTWLSAQDAPGRAIDASQATATVTRRGAKISATEGAARQIAARLPSVVSARVAASAASRTPAGKTSAVADDSAYDHVAPLGIVSRTDAARAATRGVQATDGQRPAASTASSATRAASTETVAFSARTRAPSRYPTAWTGASAASPVVAPVADLAALPYDQLVSAIARRAPSAGQRSDVSRAFGAIPARSDASSVGTAPVTLSALVPAAQRRDRALRTSAPHEVGIDGAPGPSQAMFTSSLAGADRVGVTSTPAELFAANHLEAQRPRLSTNLNARPEMATRAGEVRVDAGAYALGFDDSVVFLNASDLAAATTSTPAVERASRMSPSLAATLGAFSAPLSSAVRLGRALAATAATRSAAASPSAPFAGVTSGAANSHAALRAGSTASSSVPFGLDGSRIYPARVPGGLEGALASASNQVDPSGAPGSAEQFSTRFTTAQAAALPRAAADSTGPAYYQVGSEIESVFLGLDSSTPSMPAGSHVEVRNGRVVRSVPATTGAARAARVAASPSPRAGASTLSTPASQAAPVSRVAPRSAAGRATPSQSPASQSSQSVSPGAIRTVSTGGSSLERGGPSLLSRGGSRVPAGLDVQSVRSADRRAVSAIAEALLGGLPTLSRETRGAVEARLGLVTRPGAATETVSRLSALLAGGGAPARTAIAAQLASMGVDVGELLSVIHSSPTAAAGTELAATRAPGRTAAARAAAATATAAGPTDSAADPSSAANTAFAGGTRAARAQHALRALTGTSAAGRLEGIASQDRYFGDFAPVRLTHETPTGRLRALLSGDAGETPSTSRLAAMAEIGEVLGLREASIGNATAASEGLVAARRTAGRSTLRGSPASVRSESSNQAQSLTQRLADLAKTDGRNAKTAASDGRPATIGERFDRAQTSGVSFADRIGLASTPWQPGASRAADTSTETARLAELSPEMAPLALRADVSATAPEAVKPARPTRRDASRAAAGSSSAAAGRAAAAPGADGSRWFKSLSTQTARALLRALPGQRALSSAIPGGLELAAMVIDRANGAFANLDAGISEFLSRTAARGNGGDGRELRPGIDEWPAETMDMLAGTGWGGGARGDSASAAPSRSIEPRVQRLERRVDAARNAWARLQTSKARGAQPRGAEGVNWDLVSTGATRETPGGADLSRLASTMVRPATVAPAEMAYVAPAVKVVAQQAQLSESPGRGRSATAQSSQAATSPKAAQAAKVDYEALAPQVLAILARKWEFEKQRRGGG